jgi:hypothetical protein
MWKALAKLHYKVNLDAIMDNKFSGRLGISIIVVRDHGRYVHAVRSMTRLSHLERVAAEALAAFHASFFFAKN